MAIKKDEDYLMTDLIKIIVRYADYRVVKGYSRDFFPNKSLFHLELIAAGHKGEISEVHMKDLKAVFFVRDFIGNPLYNERKSFTDGQLINGRKVRVSFKDGEMLVGSTMGYDPKRDGFFLFPPDTQSNNMKVFVVLSAVSRVDFIQ
jgi:hypothetical protein